MVAVDSLSLILYCAIMLESIINQSWLFNVVELLVRVNCSHYHLMNLIDANLDVLREHRVLSDFGTTKRQVPQI